MSYIESAGIPADALAFEIMPGWQEEVLTIGADDIEVVAPGLVLLLIDASRYS